LPGATIARAVSVISLVSMAFLGMAGAGPRVVNGKF